MGLERVYCTFTVRVINFTTDDNYHTEIARISSGLIYHFTGIQPVTYRIPVGQDHFRAKLELLISASSQGQFLFLDTDTLVTRPWGLDPLLRIANHGYLGVAHAVYQDRVAARIDKFAPDWWFKIDPRKYFNTGVVVGSAVHTQLFQSSLALYDKVGNGIWGDEGPINLECQRLGYNIAPLPIGVNYQWLRRQPVLPDATVLHLLGNDSNKLSSMRDFSHIIYTQGRHGRNQGHRLP